LTLRNVRMPYSRSGIPRASSSATKPPDRRRHANSSANRRGSSARPSAMNCCSVPPHMSVVTTFSSRTGLSSMENLVELGSANSRERNRQTGDAEEVELIRNGIEERGDDEPEEGDANA